MKKLMLIIVVMLSFYSLSFGSEVTVTHYPDADSTQIWIDVNNFDFSTGDFQRDTSLTGTLSGSAYYFPNYDGPSTYQPWYAEYSIAASDMSGVTLGGGKTWYFWARANQPFAGSEESDVVFVKGDPDDGSGESWYSDALASVDVTDDRILNDLAAVGPTGTWVWSSTETEPTVSKEFNLDSNNEVVFAISERESGLSNARIDAIMWTDDPDFIPTDTDYLGTSVYGVQQVYDGRTPGDIPHIVWSPLESSCNAYIYGVGPGTDKPIYYPVDGGGGYDFSYTLNSSDSSQDSGSMIDLGSDFIPDYDEDFSVEVWFRADGCPAENQQQALWSTQSFGSNGMRLFIWDWGGTSGKFGIGFEARDNSGDKVRWATNDTNDGNKYAFGQWMQVVAVYDANGSGSGMPRMKIYTNGELKQDSGFTDPVPSDTNFVDPDAIQSLGCNYPLSGNNKAKDHKMYFDGGVALVKTYDKVVSQMEISDSYNENKSWIIDNSPFDPAVDEPFEEPNHVEIQDGLIFKLDANEPGSVPHLACIDGQTRSTGEVEHLGPSGSSHKPVYYKTEDGAGYEFSYNSDSGGFLNCGNIKPDYNEPFTIEMWVRPDGFTSDCKQQDLFTNQSLFKNGFRFFIADWAVEQKYRLNYEMRAGDEGSWYAVEDNDGQLYDVGQWKQLVGVYEPNGAGQGRPNIKMYVDGQLKYNQDMTEPVPDANFIMPKNKAYIGGRGVHSDTRSTKRHYFDGGFALIRVYDRVLNALEVETNFDNDKGWIIDNLPYDPSTNPPYSPPPNLPKIETSLLQEYSAASPGDLNSVSWQSMVAGSSDGGLYSVGPDDHPDRWPQYVSGAYQFTTHINEPNSSGGAIDIGNQFIPDYDDDFTVEVWVAPDNLVADNHQQTLWGTQQVRSSNGMRFHIYSWNATFPDFYGLGFDSRDNTDDRARWYVNAPIQYPTRQWKQLVLSYDGSTNRRPLFEAFVDGQKVVETSEINIEDSVPADKDFIADNVPPRQILGNKGVPEEDRYEAKDTRQYYQGSMALVRVYNRRLAEGEVLANYENDQTWINALPTYENVSLDPSAIPEPAKADVDQSRNVDFSDFAVIAAEWLVSPISDDRADINQDGNVDLEDLEKIAEYWLSDF